MNFRQRRAGIVTAVLLAVAGLFLAWPEDTAPRQGLARQDGGSPGRDRLSVPVPSRERPPVHRSVAGWQREVESLLGHHEARRSRILSRKQTPESELYLLGVEPPREEEISDVRSALETLIRGVAPENRASCEEKLAALVEEYDPYGQEGLRIIQIDVPDEPNGRLTGFSCKAVDFGHAVDAFQKGEMIGLENLRGYAASYAGMPLTRFSALIVSEGSGGDWLFHEMTR